MVSRKRLDMSVSDRLHPLKESLEQCSLCETVKEWSFLCKNKKHECFNCHIRHCTYLKMEIVKEFNRVSR